MLKFNLLHPLYILLFCGLIISGCENNDNVSGPSTDPESPTPEAEAPAINSVTPESGPVGTEVTITGENFSPTTSENTVTFNGTEAAVDSASETRLITQVPEGADSGPIEVTVDGQTATGPDFEIVTENLVQSIDSDSELNILADLLRGTSLASTLEGEGPYTILAPTDSALSLLGEGFWDDLTQTEKEEILSYHVITSDVEAVDLAVNRQEVETMQGEFVYTTTSSTQTYLNNKARVGSSSEAPNGRIIKISSLLLPDAYLDVFEIMYKRYVTNKFACSCVSGRTNLDDVLKDESASFTVFAPNDNAFNNYSVPVDSLTDGELQNLLNYHIVDDEILQSGDLSEGQTLTTRTGQEITISASGGSISVNGATVVTADLVGTNGVVHIIDAVIEPPSDN